MSAAPIYCDYCATTPLLTEVQSFIKSHVSMYGNSSSMHALGRRSKALLESSRASIAAHLGTVLEQLIFTSSATEANNQILKSLLFRKQAGLKSDLIVSSIEHSSIRNTAIALEELGINVTRIPALGNGSIDLSALKSMITSETGLVSVLMVNNETGVIQPIKEVVDIAKAHDVLVHTDAVQALGRIPVSFSEFDVDFLTVSGHKCYAPKGVAAMCFRDDAFLKPLLHGGTHERQLRAGTENVLGIGAFSRALDVVLGDFHGFQERLRLLSETFVEGLLSRLDNVSVNGDDLAPGIVNLSFLGVTNHGLAMNLDLEGIYVSTGAACSSGAFLPSPVLVSMGLSEEQNMSSLRFSFGRDTTPSDVDRLLEVIPSVVKRLRSLKPVI